MTSVNLAIAMPGDEGSLADTRLVASIELSTLADIEFEDCMKLKTPPTQLYLDLVVIDEYETCRQSVLPAIQNLYKTLYQDQNGDTSAINMQIVELNRWLAAVNLKLFTKKKDNAAGFAGDSAIANATNQIAKLNNPIGSVYTVIQDRGYQAIYFLFDLPKAQKALDDLYAFKAQFAELRQQVPEETAQDILFHLNFTLVKALEAHSANTLIFDNDDQRKEINRKLIEALNSAQDHASSEENKLVVLFHKYKSAMYLSSMNSRDKLSGFSPQALATEIENSSRSDALRSINLWSRLKQIEIASLDIGARDDRYYKKWLSLIDALEKDVTEVADGVIWMDCLLLRYQVLRNLDFYDDSITYVERIVNRLQEFQENAPELAKSNLWGWRIANAIQSASEGLTHQERYDEAQSLLKHQWETWKDNQSALNLAAVYLAQGNYSEAVKVGGQINFDELNSLASIWRFNQSLAYYKSGDIEKAKEALMRGSSINKFDKTEVPFYIGLLAISGDLDAAKNLAGKVASESIGGKMAAALKSYIAISSFNENDTTLQLGIVNEPLPIFAFKTLFFEDEYFENGYPYVVKQTQSTGSAIIEPTLVVSGGVGSLTAESFDQSLLATASGELVTIWNMEKGLPTRKLVIGEGVRGLEFFDNDTQLLVISGNAIEAFDIANGELKYSIARDSNEWFTPIVSKTLVKLISASNKEMGLAISALNNPSDSQTIAIKEQIAQIALDSTETRLFVAVNKVPDNDNWISSIYVVDLISRRIIGESKEISGIVKLLQLTENDETVVVRIQPDVYMYSDPVRVDIKNEWKLTEKLSIKPSYNETNQALSLMKKDELISIEVGPEKAFFDEENQQLIYQANISQLHIWDTELGSELSVVDQHFKNFYYRNNTIVGIKEDMYGGGKGTVLFKSVSSGGATEEQFTVPMVDGIEGYSRDLEYFEGGEHLYAQVGNGYDAGKRALLKFNDQGAGELMPFELEGEDIYSLVDGVGFVSEKDRDINLRTIETGEIISSFRLEETWASFKWIEIDANAKTIWIATYDSLYAYSLSGDLKYQYDDLIGDFESAVLPQNGSPLIAVYKIGNSTQLVKIDRLNGQVLNTNVLENRIVSTINLSSNQNYLTMTRTDGGVELWNIAESSELATLFSLPNGGWLVIDADGRYDSNRPGKIRSVAWRMSDAPLNPLSVAVFMKQFYEPRLLPRKINQAPFPEVTDLDQINIVQPEVSFELAEPNKNNAGNLDITLRINAGEKINKISSDYGAYDLRLFRDGQQVAFYPEDHGQIELNADGQKTITFKDIKLPWGDVGKVISFSAMAFNNQGVKSNTAELTYVLNKAQKTAKRRAFIITVGVNTYTNTAWNLDYAVNDADLLAGVLKKGVESTNQYDDIITIPLTTDANKLINYNDVENVFQNIAQGKNGIPQIMPDDALILTWSGHGYADKTGTFHLITSDVGEGGSKKIDDAFLQNSVSTDDLSIWLESIDAKNMVLVIDACNSAASVEGKGFKPGPMGSKGFGQLAWFKGMQILTASQSDDVALESNLLKHGLLTYSLAKEGLALSAADYLPSDNMINTSEWLKFGQKRVPELYLALVNGNLSEALLDSRGVELDEPRETIEPQLPGLFDFNRSVEQMNLSIKEWNKP